MKRTAWILLAATAAILLFSAIRGPAAEEAPASSSAAEAKAANGGVLRHVVLFKFKDDAPPEKIKAAEAAFAELPSKIPEIVDFEWGTDVSTENKAQGFTHCFLVTFKDAHGRDAYLPHPAHKAFGQVLKGIIDKVLVIDFQAQPAK